MDRTSSRQILLSAADNLFAATMIQVLKSHRYQGGWLTISQMSHLTELSVRTLQRRLASEGVAFSGLVQTARKELAIELMNDDTLSVNQIAAQLGYSRISNFSRAFQRWTGKSPTEFRHDEV